MSTSGNFVAETAKIDASRVAFQLKQEQDAKVFRKQMKQHIVASKSYIRHTHLIQRPTLYKPQRRHDLDQARIKALSMEIHINLLLFRGKSNLCLIKSKKSPVYFLCLLLHGNTQKIIEQSSNCICKYFHHRIRNYKLIEGSPGKYNDWFLTPKHRFRIRYQRRNVRRNLQLTQLFDLEGKTVYKICCR